MQKNEKFLDAWAKIVTRCWDEELFKQQFLANPKKILEEYGVPTPANTEYKAIEEKEPNKRIAYLSLPKKPDGLGEEELKKISGGLTICSFPLE